MKETQKAGRKKTVWEHKSSLWFHFAAVLLVIVGLLISLLARSDYRQLTAGDTKIKLEVADTQSEREKGLSGRNSLDHNSGMLFVFEEEGKHCFWMKDTRISLDMIWLDVDKIVVDTENGVKPESYPESFCPNAPARYVIELNSDRAQELGIEQGQKLKF